MNLALGFFGTILGAIIGVLLPWAFVIVFDYINPPSGNGGGLGAVGWLLWLITIPLFTILTPIILIWANSSGIVEKYLQKRRKKSLTIVQHQSKIEDKEKEQGD